MSVAQSVTGAFGGLYLIGPAQFAAQIPHLGPFRPAGPLTLVSLHSPFSSLHLASGEL